LKQGSNKVPGFANLSFDIFKEEAEGVVWRGTAASLEDANRRIQELASESPAEYIVWNRQTGDKHAVKSGDRRDMQERSENIS